MKRVKYTEEQIQWIQEKALVLRDKDAAKEFNRIFRRNISKQGYTKIRQRVGAWKFGWYPEDFKQVKREI